MGTEVASGALLAPRRAAGGGEETHGPSGFRGERGSNALAGRGSDNVKTLPWLGRRRWQHPSDLKHKRAASSSGEVIQCPWQRPHGGIFSGAPLARCLEMTVHRESTRKSLILQHEESWVIEKFDTLLGCRRSAQASQAHRPPRGVES